MCTSCKPFICGKLPLEIQGMTEKKHHLKWNDWRGFRASDKYRWYTVSTKPARLSYENRDTLAKIMDSRLYKYHS